MEYKEFSRLINRLRFYSQKGKSEEMLWHAIDKISSF